MKADCGGELQDETAYLDGRMRVKLARNEFVGAGRIIHHIQWLYRGSMAYLVCTYYYAQVLKQKREEAHQDQL
jgi:hypothetical protein